MYLAEEYFLINPVITGVISILMRIAQLIDREAKDIPRGVNAVPLMRLYYIT